MLRKRHPEKFKEVLKEKIKKEKRKKEDYKPIQG